MKLTVRQIEPRTGFEGKLRRDVSPAISKVGVQSIAKHHEFIKGKFEDDNYNPIKFSSSTSAANPNTLPPNSLARGNLLTDADSDDEIENEFIRRIDLVD